MQYVHGLLRQLNWHEHMIVMDGCHDVGRIKCKAGGQGNEGIATGIEFWLHVGQKLFEISESLHSTA